VSTKQGGDLKIQRDLQKDVKKPTDKKDTRGRKRFKGTEEEEQTRKEEGQNEN
jgi:hypothetical protein